MAQGFHIRLCGQDAKRGTFSHRHLVVVDQVMKRGGWMGVILLMATITSYYYYYFYYYYYYYYCHPLFP